MINPKNFSKYAILLLMLLMPLTMAMVAAPSEPSLVEASCQGCHSLKKVCKKMGQSETAWAKTLKRMQNKGSGLTDNQNTLLAAFLSKTNAKTSGLCN